MADMINKDLDREKTLLEFEGYTCVLCRDDKVYVSTKRGVSPLLEWLESSIDMKGFSAADKVIGKAAAFLFVLAGIREVYAPVISTAAMGVFEQCGIKAVCDLMPDRIVNRAGTGLCPMETAVWDIEEPETALKVIKSTVKKMQQLN